MKKKIIRSRLFLVRLLSKNKNKKINSIGLKISFNDRRRRTKKKCGATIYIILRRVVFFILNNIIIFYDLLKKITDTKTTPGDTTE